MLSLTPALQKQLFSLLPRAYAPYSKVHVAALLKTQGGHYYGGVNVENAGIQSICAERTAFVKAISEGERDFSCLYLCGAKEGEGDEDLIPLRLLPCGYCRQFMAEFVPPSFPIVVLSQEGGEVQESIYSLGDLLPEAFGL